MKALSLTFGVAALFALASVQACPGMNKVTQSIKQYTDQVTDAAQSPQLPDTEKKLVVDVEKPAQGTAN